MPVKIRRFTIKYVTKSKLSKIQVHQVWYLSYVVLRNHDKIKEEILCESKYYRKEDLPYCGLEIKLYIFCFIASVSLFCKRIWLKEQQGVGMSENIPIVK